MFRTMKALIVVMLISSVTGCVASVNKTLPFEQLPEITLATNVDLVASPSHPNSSLPSAHVEAGKQLR